LAYNSLAPVFSQVTVTVRYAAARVVTAETGYVRAESDSIDVDVFIVFLADQRGVMCCSSAAD